MKKIILCLITFLSTITAQEFQYKLSICAVIQDEGLWLKEWIEYHLLTGVEHFWIYDNNSKDNSTEVLKPYIEQGVVELIDRPLSSHNYPAYLDMQVGGYNDVLKYAKGRTEWLAFIDVDEFIVPIQEKKITETLDNHFSEFAGVIINWQFYGTSHVKKIQPHELMVEMLNHRAPANFHRHIRIKSIVKPLLVTGCLNPHYFGFIPGNTCVDTHGQPISRNKVSIYTDVLVINHYWLKDEEYLHSVRIPRYNFWHGQGDWILNFYDLMNEEEDRIMERFVPELKKRVFGS